MSQENVSVAGGVRTPVAVPSKARRRRRLDERILVRFPALVRLLGHAVSRLPPRSRLRRAFLSRITRQACEAAKRRDFGFLFLPLDPEEFEYHIDEVGGMLPPDLKGVHHGPEGFLRAWQAAIEAMEDFTFEIDELIDFGDRLLTIGRQSGHGRSSGIAVSQPLFQLFTLRRGLVIRQVDFADRDKALEAVGLPE